MARPGLEPATPWFANRLAFDCARRPGWNSVWSLTTSEHAESFTFYTSHYFLSSNQKNHSCLDKHLKTDFFQHNEQIKYMSPVKRICVFEHSVMTNFNCACPAIQRGQGSGFLSEGSSWLNACMSEQRRFWRDCADAQARLNLRCSHRR